LTEGAKAWYAPKKFTPFQEDGLLKMKRKHRECVNVMRNLNTNYDWDYGRQKEFEDDLQRMQFGDVTPVIAQVLYDRDTSGPQDIFGGWFPQAYPEAAA
jgi:hypothetical protein